MSRKRPHTVKPALKAAEFWTPEEDAVLRDGVERRVGYRFIGNQIGRSAEACRDRVKRLGLIKEPQKRRRSAQRRGGLSLPQVPGEGPIASGAPFENLEAWNRAFIASLLAEYAPGLEVYHGRTAYSYLNEIALTPEPRFIAPTSGYVYHGSCCSSPAGEVV